MAGFGAVVTGTLDGGQLKVGDEVSTASVWRNRPHPRITEPQISNRYRGAGYSSSGQHQRDFAHRDVERGEALVKRGQFNTTTVFDASLRTISDAKRPVKHNHHVTLYGGTWEEPATVRLLSRDELKAGETGWAQIKMSNPRPIIKGDRFVIRDSNDTLGGGVALITNAPRHRRNDPSVIEHLQVLSEGRPEDVILHALGQLVVASCTQIAEAAHMLTSDIEAEVSELTDKGDLIRLMARCDTSIHNKIKPRFVASSSEGCANRLPQQISATPRDATARTAESATARFEWVRRHSR